MILKKLNKTNISIAGHTDSSDSDSYNMTLSRERAQSVSNVLSC
ncbi:MAG: OmpA family protein [Gammaproteobacteria bacterium]|nr:OmpA family protein [Gammaproteobacteria bacterium]